MRRALRRFQKLGDGGPAAEFVNLRDLEYLTALAEHRHFRKAAEACFVSQPALSGQIRKLESQLGVTLIERSRRAVMLTPIGEEIVARARRILGEVQALRDAAELARNPMTGEVVIGVIPTAAPYLLPHVLPKCRAEHPTLRLLFVEDKTRALLDRLQDGQLDGVIAALPAAGSQGLESRELFREPFHAAAPRNHALAKQETICEGDLRGARVMLLEEGHCLRDQALSVCQSAEKSAFGATSLETLRQMVRAEMGVTLMPALATLFEGSGTSGDIAYIPCAAADAYRRIAMFWRKTTARKAALEAVAEIIAAEANELLANLGEGPLPRKRKRTRGGGL